MSMSARFRQPERLRQVADPGSPLFRALSAARARGPSAADVRALEGNVFLALGASSAAAEGRGAEAPGAPRASGGAGAASHAGAAVPGAMGGITAKVVLVLALAAGGGALGLHLLPRERVTERSVEAIARPPAPSPGAPAPSAPYGPSPPPRLVDAVENPGPSRSAPRFSRSRPGGATVRDPVRAELKLIDRARSLLAADPRRAIAIGETHATRFPRGVMAEERDAIIITALQSLGRTREAESRQATFRREHPDSPYAVRGGWSDGGPLER